MTRFWCMFAAIAWLCAPALGGTTIEVQATLVAKADAFNAKDILPYEDAWVVYQYAVDPDHREQLGGASRIRVMHWGIRQGRVAGRVFKAKVGKAYTLGLDTFDARPDAASVETRDAGLEDELGLPVFVDAGYAFGPPRMAYHDHDFGSRLTYKIPSLHLLRGQVRLVVLGDSRADTGVDPALFFTDRDGDTPVAFNMGLGSSGLGVAEVIAAEYLTHCAKLEWVVICVGPRWFSKHYKDPKLKDLLKSPALRADRKADFAAWRKPVVGRVTLAELGALNRKDRARAGISDLGQGTSYLKGTLDAAKQREQLLKRFSKDLYRDDAARWAQFERLVQTLTQHGTRVLLYTPVAHPLTAEATAADEDGTTNVDYAALIERLRKIASDNERVTFENINRAGRHGFGPELFYDQEHLNAAGTAKLTAMLESIRQRLDKTD